MKYSFHPEAEAELIAAIDYYESREPGLGSDFAIEVHSAIENIISFPQAWPLLEGDLRRCQTRRFPYGVIYSQDEDIIFILASGDAFTSRPRVLESQALSRIISKRSLSAVWSRADRARFSWRMV